VTLRVCDVFNVVEVGNRVQVFDWIFVSVGFWMVSGFNGSGRPANSHILCNLKVFRMVLFDMFKWPAV